MRLTARSGDTGEVVDAGLDPRAPARSSRPARRVARQPLSRTSTWSTRSSRVRARCSPTRPSTTTRRATRSTCRRKLGPFAAPAADQESELDGRGVSHAPRPAGVLRPWQRRLYGSAHSARPDRRQRDLPRGLHARHRLLLRDAAAAPDARRPDRDSLLRLRRHARQPDDSDVEQAGQVRGARDLHARRSCAFDRTLHDLPGATLEQPRRLAPATSLGARSPSSRSSSTGARTPTSSSSGDSTPGAAPSPSSSARWPSWRSWRSRRSASSTSTATRSSSRPPPRRSTRGSWTERSWPPTATARRCHPGLLPPVGAVGAPLLLLQQPVLPKSVELMADQSARATKWCCGLPRPRRPLHRAESGAATQAAFSYDSWEAQQGLTCMSCHSITEVKDVKGNGSYVIEEAKQYPLRVLRTRSPGRQPAAHPHGALAPPQDVPEAAHAHAGVLLDLPQGRADPGAQQLPLDARPDRYEPGTTRRLGARRSLLLRSAQPKACRDCHLPPYPSHDFGSRKDHLHDHLFPAANTALPFVRGRENDEGGSRSSSATRC